MIFVHWKVYEAIRFTILGSYSNFGATKKITQSVDKIFWSCPFGLRLVLRGGHHFQILLDFELNLPVC